MASVDVLSIYEKIAGLTSQMVDAARSGDWDGLRGLEEQCAAAVRRVEEGDYSALTGIHRLRKVDLIKRILADDREIRAITEPWIAQAAQSHRSGAAHAALR